MANDPDLYIGLMSGTSVNSIDAVIVDFSSSPPYIVASHEHPISTPTRTKIVDLCTPTTNELEKAGHLDRELGLLFAEAVSTLLTRNQISSDKIRAIGSHGQTIRHHANGVNGGLGFTIQIADPSTIAAITGIPTVADFRSKDIALGGQGAPLTPAFHKEFFTDSCQARCILNIGGIANITYLPESNNPKKLAFGFDTGPGNVLMDYWIGKNQNALYDSNGDWARSGSVCNELLNKLLCHPYFALPHPKSTGREDFNADWIAQYLLPDVPAENIQATLCELTAQSIADAIITNCTDAQNIYVCGGGAHNAYLTSRIQEKLAGKKVLTTDNLNISPDWVEAYAFAWFARQTMNTLPSNLPAVTGASKLAVLGGIYYP